jgi:hypothetical protein
MGLHGSLVSSVSVAATLLAAYVAAYLVIGGLERLAEQGRAPRAARVYHAAAMQTAFTGVAVNLLGPASLLTVPTVVLVSFAASLLVLRLVERIE